MQRLAWCSSISLAMSALSSHTTDWMRLCSGVLPCAHTILHQEHCCCCCCCVSKAEARDGVRQGSTGAQGMTLLWSGPFRRGSGGGWGGALFRAEGARLFKASLISSTKQFCQKQQHCSNALRNNSKHCCAVSNACKSCIRNTVHSLAQRLQAYVFGPGLDVGSMLQKQLDHCLITFLCCLMQSSWTLHTKCNRYTVLHMS